MFAIVKIAGKQYAVRANDIVDVDRIEGEEGTILSFADVLLRDDNGKVTVGEPIITGAKVTAKLLKQYRGEKLNVRRFKAKSRHRRSIGFRPSLTKLQVISIS